MTIPAQEHTEPGGAGAGRRAVIIGDSWIRGLGPERRRASGKTIARGLGATEILDLAAISRTAPDVVADHLTQIRAFSPHLALVGIGGADSLVFPGFGVQRAIERFAPAQWHGVEGLMPLAKFSREKRRRRRQLVEQTLKMVLKQVLVRGLPSRRRVSLAGFETAAAVLLDELGRIGCVAVVLGFPRVDGWLSPKTNASVTATNERLTALCAARPHAIFVPTAELVHRWDDYLSDHVHLAAEGHQAVSDGVLAALRDFGAPWAELVESAVATS